MWTSRVDIVFPQERHTQVAIMLRPIGSLQWKEAIGIHGTGVDFLFTMVLRGEAVTMSKLTGGQFIANGISFLVEITHVMEVTMFVPTGAINLLYII